MVDAEKTLFTVFQQLGSWLSTQNR